MTWLQDLRFALRSLRSHAGTTAFATLTLACGLAAAIAIVCVVDAVLLRSLPYADSSRIVQLGEVARDGYHMALARPNYEDIVGSKDAFDRIGFHADYADTVSAGRDVIRTHIDLAGGDFFRVFGLAPQAGRVFTANESERVAVVSDGFWHGFLQGRGDIIGSALDVAGERYTVIGVMPPAFAFPADTSVWLPAPNGAGDTSRSAHNWHAVARIASARSIASVQMEMRTLAQRLQRQYGEAIDAVDFSVTPLAAAIAAPVRAALLMLALGTAFLFLIAITNTTNLLLALNGSRARELAVRAALGASGTRIARQIFFESLLIAASACVLALAGAELALGALIRNGGAQLPRLNEIHLHAAIVAIAVTSAIAIAVVLTLAVSLNTRRRQPVRELRESGRGQSPGRASLRTRTALLVAQTALTTVLLVGCGLLVRSFLALLAVDPGFHAEGAVSVQLSQPATDDQAAAMRTAERYRALMDAFTELPGVRGVGGINALPLTADGADGSFWDGSVTQITEPMPKPIGYGEFRVISAGYFGAVGIPLQIGRVFDARDRAGGAPVAIVSAALARATWGTRDPIGQRVQSGNMDGQMQVATVIGVVGDVHEHRLDRTPTGTLYVDIEQRPVAAAEFNVVVRSDRSTGALADALRGVLEQRASGIPYRLHPLADVRADALADRRFSLILLGAFASVAFVLAVGGLYGLTAFAVGQRRHEFALRQALGATRARIARLVFGHALAVGASGVAIGLAMALQAAHVARAFLYGVGASDPLTLFGVAALLLATVVIACIAPARHACAAAPREVLA